MIWWIIQVSIILGTVLFFGHIAPENKSYGAMAVIGIVLAFFFTVVLSKTVDLIRRNN